MTLDVPTFIQHPQGVFCLDVLPLISLLPCCFTLDLFRKSKRYADLFIFSLGFSLAFLYHWCQMNPDGLEQSMLFGIKGTVWRTLDVLCCPMLLTRTVGHICGTSSISLKSMLPDMFFPAIVLSMHFSPFRLQTWMIAILALSVMLITILSVVLFYGKEFIPQYRSFQAKLIFSTLLLSVMFLLLPNYYENYWLFHSFWHLFLSIGYFTLYSEIERPKHDYRLTNGKTL